MKISVTQNDYRRLLMMLFTADWVFNARRVDPPAGLRRKCGESFERFLAHAVNMGCADLVEEIHGRLAPSDVLENDLEVMEIIEDYDADTFWQELAERLAERDYENRHGAGPAGNPAVPPLSDQQRFERLVELEDLEAPYWSDFEASGIKNLHVIRGVGRPS